MSEVIERLKAKFAVEAAVSLDRIDQWVGELHRGGRRREIAGRIREEAHGLKGAAAVLEFHEFRDRTAALETAAADLGELDEWPMSGVIGLENLAREARQAQPTRN